MRVLHTLLAFALACGFLGGAAADDGAKAKKKANAQPVVGAITEVKKDDGKETGTVTIKTVKVEKKKDAVTAPADGEEKKIKVTAATKVERRAGKKADQTTAEAVKFSDLKSGDRIAVVLKSGTSDVAESVQVLPTPKKKK